MQSNSPLADSSQPIRVLVVDDATFMVKAVSGILESDAGVTVVGSAKNGQDALEKIKELEPDVITLDMDMPVMDGIRAIRHIMIQCPVPIVVLSSLYDNGAITFEALRLGVVDFLPKPSGAVSRDIHVQGQHIIDRIRMATSVNINNVRRVRLNSEKEDQGLLSERFGFRPMDYLLAVGTSLSGPNTIIRLLAGLPASLPCGVVILMDIAPKILDSFVDKFNEYVHWHVQVAEEGQELAQGSCYLSSTAAPVVIAVSDEGKPVLQMLAEDPAPIDRFFVSAAEQFKEQCVGLLLSGPGEDGAQGCQRIKEAGGTTIAQATDTCVYPNLSQNAISEGNIDLVREEAELVDSLVELLDRGAGET
ncbi:MAG: chemotaxis protein CheB [Thermodesulfobacteriota bacterium]